MRSSAVTRSRTSKDRSRVSGIWAMRPFRPGRVSADWAWRLIQPPVPRSIATLSIEGHMTTTVLDNSQAVWCAVTARGAGIALTLATKRSINPKRSTSPQSLQSVPSIVG
ncbi:hypothetical protein BT67DRAFT_198648 [Trichocladium antarcticum]|uniref:Uncharacterized protein n=1 Tax=Trichocladium antarcticum TaxID=1450529 RepID=A0AAN6UPW7_9PEZI|nr:hypothetical protein BT67DRAFT_198648 [Trichocladium antarcticum]